MKISKQDEKILKFLLEMAIVRIDPNDSLNLDREIEAEDIYDQIEPVITSMLHNAYCAGRDEIIERDLRK